MKKRKRKKNGKKKKLQPAPCLAQPVAAVLTKSARTAASSPCSDSSPCCFQSLQLCRHRPLTVLLPRCSLPSLQAAHHRITDPS
jgi:hypothetical protein